MAVRLVNEQSHRFAELFEHLLQEGHRVFVAEAESASNPVELYETLKEFREIESTTEDRAIATEENITQSKYEELSRKRSKSKQERYREKKHELQQECNLCVAYR